VRPSKAKIKAIAGALGLALCAANLDTARAGPANTLIELRDALNACLRTTSPGGKLDVTIIFSLKRDGNLLGKPVIRYSKMTDAPDARRRGASAVAAALQGCLPLPITESLGNAIAGRPFAIRIRLGEAAPASI